MAGFICGGSLISRKLVVTAAHCIQRKGDYYEDRIKAEEILFHFGNRNLSTLDNEEGYVFSAVRDIFIHPDWSYQTQEYDADISIAVLTRTIVFNKFVKPICIWTATNSFKDLIEVAGVTTGGLSGDENKQPTTARLKWAKIPVVSTETCLRSHSLFRSLTSERNFCAGESLLRISRVYSISSSLCTGDSGNVPHEKSEALFHFKHFQVVASLSKTGTNGTSVASSQLLLLTKKRALATLKPSLCLQTPRNSQDGY